MTDLRLSGLKVDSSSYVDPNGFVFGHNDRIYRAIYPRRESFYRSLFENKTIGTLTAKSCLVESEISDYKIPEIGCNLVIKHRKIEPLNYCVEWCPSMLKAAAGATLEMNLTLLEKGCMLQDAYPWNVLFDSTRPVFIDLASIVPVERHLLWPAYQQFINFFMNPLDLCSMGKDRVARLSLFDCVNGLPPDDFNRNISPGYVLSNPLRSGLSLLSAVAARKIDSSLKSKLNLQNKIKSQGFSRIDNELRKRFLSGLVKRVGKMNVHPKRTSWTGYYDDLNGSSQGRKKMQTIDGLLAGLSPKSVLDVGSNIGRFSILAAGKGARVVAIDTDVYCVEALYKEADSKKLKILPLVVDILNPTPAFGFLSRQFPPFMERCRSDVTLFLGIMHHLHVNGRQSFEHIAGLIDELSARASIFEYVDAADNNIKAFDHGRKIDYSLKTVRDSLGRYFKLTTFESDRPTRKILLCER